MDPLKFLGYVFFVLILGGFTGYNMAELIIFKHCKENGEYFIKSPITINADIECNSAWWNEDYGSPTKQFFLKAK